MFIQGVGIDSGFNTLVYLCVCAEVYAAKIPQVFALKGVGGWNARGLEGIEAAAYLSRLSTQQFIRSRWTS